MSRFRVISRALPRLTRQQMYDIIRGPVITDNTIDWNCVLQRSGA